MKRTIQKLGLAFVIVAILASTMFATSHQPPGPEPELSDNFRINVVTDRNGYVSGGRLALTIELLNNSPIGTHIVLPEPNENDPNRPVIIGRARLIPLRRPRPVEDDEQADVDVEVVEGPQAVKQVPLRLLGGRQFIPGHSTVIISVAGMRLARRQAPDEPGGEVEVVGLRPGLYLLDCDIIRIAGVPRAHAEKIIRILPPRHDNGRRPPQAQRPRRGPRQ